jgi:hypothetical protein
MCFHATITAAGSLICLKAQRVVVHKYLRLLPYETERYCRNRIVRPNLSPQSLHLSSAMVQ